LDADIDILKHESVPDHRAMSKEEVDELISRFKISILQLPLITSKDPVVKRIEAVVGDVVEVKRKGPPTTHIYYRRVVE